MMPSPLVLPLPPSSNRYWRVWRGRAVTSDEARRYKQTAHVRALAHGLRPLPGLVAVRIHVYRDVQRTDLDNRLKITLDALRGVAYSDDRQVTYLEARQRTDRAHPRLEVWVHEDTEAMEYEAQQRPAKVRRKPRLRLVTAPEGHSHAESQGRRRRRRSIPPPGVRPAYVPPGGE